MQQLGYFSLFIARELRIEDVDAFQASKSLRTCTMRVLKRKHQPLVSALTLCTLVTHWWLFFKKHRRFKWNGAQCNILSMSTLTDLQRNKCNFLPQEIITYDTSIIQWNYPSPYMSVMIISTLATTSLLRCIYLRLLDSMFRFELWGRVRTTWQTATELDRPWQTLADLALPSRNKPCPATDILQVVLRYVTFRHVLLRSPRSTTAHLSRSIPPWLPWQIFWLFKNLSRRSRQPWRATFVDPVPIRCVTVTPFRPRWPKSWLPWSPGT